MEKITERFSVEVTETGLVIEREESTRLEFSPLEYSLMLGNRFQQRQVKMRCPDPSQVYSWKRVF
jgi:hypothetical protein